jgi:hypothetical protein
VQFFLSLADRSEDSREKGRIEIEKDKWKKENGTRRSG